MPTMDSYIVLTTPQLTALNDRAKERGYNRTLSARFLQSIDPDGFHIVGFSFIHDDDHVRTLVLVKLRGKELPAHATLDIELDVFRDLPRKQYNDAGTIVDVPAPQRKRRSWWPAW